MNFSLSGMFSFSILGLTGLLYLMLGHAITSGALFLGVGVLYDRYKTRLVFYYGSMVLFMPIFSILYFIFILSNFGFPGTSNFVGEFLVLAGGIQFSSAIILFSTFGMILSLIYSLFLYIAFFLALCKNLSFVIFVIARGLILYSRFVIELSINWWVVSSNFFFFFV